MATETEHILGIVNGLVLHRYRARLRVKPGDLVGDLYHDLPTKLDPRFAIPLDDGLSTGALLALLRRVSRSKSAWVLGGFSEYPSGELTLDEAIQTVEAQSGAAASIELGALVFYKTEFSPGRHGWETDRYLLVRDTKRKEAIARELILGQKGGRK